MSHSKTVPCKHCKVEFLQKTSRSRYCSNDCNKKYYEKFYSRNLHVGTLQLPAGTVGAMTEMFVCGDLIRRGFNVFRAVSPSCYCDLLVENGNGVKQVEVRTGYKDASGKFYFNKKISRPIDFFAVYERNSGQIAYFLPDYVTPYSFDK